MTLDELRNEHERVRARLRELDATPKLTRDIAREATDLALSELRGGQSTIKHHHLQFSKVTKLLSGGKRIVRGVASSASVDRVGDVVEPAGGKWRLPVILLAQHDHTRPIGWVRELKVQGKELHVEAEIAQGIGDADYVWSLVEAQLLNDFSIGFRALPGGTERMDNGGIRFRSWELLEVSVVCIGANQDARISRGKSPAPIKLITPYDRGAVRLIRPAREPVKLITPAQMRQQQREKEGISLKKPGYQHGVTPLKTQVKPSGGIPLIKPGQ